MAGAKVGNMRLMVIGSFGMARVKLGVTKYGEKLELLESNQLVSKFCQITLDPGTMSPKFPLC